MSDDDHEPMHKSVNKILTDPAMGPVLYWDLLRVGPTLDGSKWIATEWRTIPDYQGGECDFWNTDLTALVFWIL